MTDMFRCSARSEADAEPLAGTAPTESSLLLVERPGSWGRKAVSDSGLPDEVAAHLGSLPARVQLVRRPGGRTNGHGPRVFTVSLDDDVPRVRTTVLDDVRDVLDLAEADLTPYAGDLWLVCTNGRRDVCCAERGRPVAALLAERDPDTTWETSHLGGHRFAATLVALPSGWALGRLDLATAATAAAEIGEGRVPLELARGRVGWSAAAQYADVHLRRRHGWVRQDDVRLLRVEGADVVVATPDGGLTVTVRDEPGPSRRQSCADSGTKPTRVLSVDRVTRHD